MAEPYWSLYLDDSFQHADTSVDNTPKSNGGVPTTPAVGLANNWYDWQGGKFCINSNQLYRPGSTAGWVGTGLYRGGGEYIRDQRVVVDYPAGHQPGAIYLRFNTSTSACIWFNTPNGGYVGKLNAFNSFGGLAGTWTWTYDNTHAYQADCRVWGVSPTNWAYTLTDVTTSTVLVDTSGTITGAVEVAGAIGLEGAIGSGNRVSRVRAYSGQLLLGTLVPVAGSVTLTQTALSWTSTIGGTAPVTLELHRSTDPLATLGAGTLVADVSAVTPGTTYIDTPGGTAGTTFYYWLRATDSASPTPTVLTSQPVPLSTKIAQFKIGLIGDSITEYMELGAAGMLAAKFAELYPKYLLSVTNRGIAATSTAEWVPGSTLTAAIEAFQAAGVTHVLVMLGTNDARDVVGRSAAAYKANMQAICAALVAAGLKVVLNSPPAYRLTYGEQAPGGYTATSYSLLPQYVTKLDELANGTTIFKGDRQAFSVFAEQANTMIGDWVHPNVAGSAVLARLWHEALGAILGFTATGVSGGGGGQVGFIYG